MPEVRIVRAGISPVKGTRHLDLDVVRLDENGAVGDRRFCFIDLTGRQVLKTAQHPGLVALHAEEHGGVLTMTLPDGRSTSGAPEPTGHRIDCDYWGRTTALTVLESPHAALASEHLGRPVVLAAAPPGAVIYGAGITLITQASLDDLSARVGTSVDPARFRATFVVGGDEPSGAEDGWAGRELSIGTATIRVGAPVGRCSVIDIDPDNGRRDTRILRTLSGYRGRNGSGEPCFGVYAEVVRPGLATVAAMPPA